MAECSFNGSVHKLNPAIAALWKAALQQYPRPETKPYVRLPKLSLDPDCWFATYLNVMENFATRGSVFAKLFGCAYMKTLQGHSRYVKNLPTPNPSKTIQYNALFNKTRKNLSGAWAQLAEALEKDDISRFTLANGNLDTGKDLAGNFIYWA